MKSKISFIVASLLVLASCSKSGEAGFPGKEKVSVSFTASLAEYGSTKALFDNDGAGIHADRCRLQVWSEDKLFYEETAAVNDFKAIFEDLVLVKDQVYDFLFWADNTSGAYYVTDNLNEVKLSGTYVGGNDKRDAFYAAIVGKTVVETFSQEVELHRPFAQLNVITTDIPAIRAQITEDNRFADSVPEKVSLALTAPTVFNVRTGAVSEPGDITYTAPVYTNPYKTTAEARNTLSMDYLFAPTEDGSVVDVKFSAKFPSRGGAAGFADIDYSFSNVPLRRNYRTNISGALITVTGKVNIEIKPAWLEE